MQHGLQPESFVSIASTIFQDASLFSAHVAHATEVQGAYESTWCIFKRFVVLNCKIDTYRFRQVKQKACYALNNPLNTTPLLQLSVSLDNIYPAGT